jgi:single-strand DNA-binding protein
MALDPILTVVGNLTADPQLRVTPSGVSMCRFTVACTARVFDKSSGGYRDAEPLFLTCTAWREVAEHVAESLTKGVRVLVTGRLRQSRWETDAGDKRSAYGLDVDEVGPSLRFATATVRKLTRTNGNGAPPADPWSTSAPATATASGDEPPF